MMRTWMLLALLGTLGFAAGCKSGDDDGNGSETDVDCSSDVPAYADVKIFDTCKMCHSSQLSGTDRMLAPGDINFDTEAAAKKSAMKAVSEVEGGDMPPRDSGLKVTAAERVAFYKWALCMDK
jgi:uncharacterized membrane protein